jgi:hypothetical protein
VAAAPELEAPELDALELDAPELEAPELEAPEELPEAPELDEDAPPSLVGAAPELAPVAGLEGAGDAVVAAGEGRVGSRAVESSGAVPAAQANRASAADAPTSETTEKRRATTTGE